MGAEPSSPCAQLDHLAHLPRNRVNSQQNPSLQEVWRQETAEDTEKQTARRVSWDGKVPGVCAGTTAAEAWVPHLSRDTGRRVRGPAPSPTRAGWAVRHQEGPGCWKSRGDVETKGETHRGHPQPLGLWMPAPEKLGCGRYLEKGGVGPCQTLTPTVLGLVEKWGCVKSRELVKSGSSCFVRNSPAASRGWGAPREISAACTHSEWRVAEGSQAPRWPLLCAGD